MFGEEAVVDKIHQPYSAYAGADTVKCFHYPNWHFLAKVDAYTLKDFVKIRLALPPDAELRAIKKKAVSDPLAPPPMSPRTPS
eukprot:1887620-Pyramimonas_sp.AAC.1